ncbi:MAG: stage 0 sporulation family protein [Clostridia bacterium]|nr:stage 0 sporulation family protein [Clostridia bacterium]
MAEVVGIKFKNSGKVYYFNPSKMKLKKGEGTIVETARGIEYGKVVSEPKDVPEEKIVQPLKPILRRATPEDEARVSKNEEKIPAAMKLAAEKIAQRGLKMKLIDAEFSFEGGKVVFYFTAAGRIDFRDLVKDLATAFHLRIELRQVGIRDETRILGGIAPCGRVCCCASCMPDFRKVTIKMAKTQGLSLNPAKISGLCGRLMCCLEYENEHYSETFKRMPKVGSEVITPDGKATVVSNNMLKLIVKVKTANEDGSFVYKDYPLDAIKVKKANKLEDADQASQEELKEIKDLLD